MTHFLAVLSQAVPGREDEFEAWYVGTHLGEIVSTPGFTRGELFRTSADDGPVEYLALYRIDGDLAEARAALAASSDQRGPLSPAMAPGFRAWWLSSVGEAVTSVPAGGSSA